MWQNQYWWEILLLSACVRTRDITWPGCIVYKKKRIHKDFNTILNIKFLLTFLNIPLKLLPLFGDSVPWNLGQLLRGYFPCKDEKSECWEKTYRASKICILLKASHLNIECFLHFASTSWTFPSLYLEHTHDVITARVLTLKTVTSAKKNSPFTSTALKKGGISETK